MSQENQTPRRIGERLRQAREQQGIAVAEAAERLHILPSYVSAMESGRYGVLPGTVFLRGYVRSYARFLGLDESEIVSQLDRELGAGEDGQLKAAQTDAANGKAGRGPLAFLLASAVILVLGVLWYFQQQPAVEDLQGAPAMVQSEEVPAYESPAESGADPAVESTRSSEPSETLPSELPEEADTSGEVSDSQELAATEDEQFVQEPGADEPMGAGTSSEPASSAAEHLPPAVESGDDQVVEPAQDRLEVSFRGDSWFELTDSEGNRRVGLFREGQRLNYEGQAPFRIVVGAVSETSMVFNGTPVDFSNYRVRNNRAGLTLGQ